MQVAQKNALAADQSACEPILDSELPIVDAHHHLWLMPEAAVAAIESRDSVMGQRLGPTFRRNARYLLDEFLTDLHTGHNICATVFIDAHTMYRTRGPESLRSVGEVEFVNGIAAMADSGVFGNIHVCAGIVGNVELRSDNVEEVLTAHLQAGGTRYRGIRSSGVVHDSDAGILGTGVGRPHVLLDSQFRKGFRHLAKFGLSYDAWVLEPQLPDVIDLAHTFPDTQIVLDHVGAPVGVGRYAGQREHRFPVWRNSILTLARCENVTVKLGGLGIPFAGFASFGAGTRARSEILAEEWRPYIDTCINAFGAERCMFESNFPIDSATCSYPVLWNAFKRLAAGASADEKSALFGGTAQRVYRLTI